MTAAEHLSKTLANSASCIVRHSCLALFPTMNQCYFVWLALVPLVLYLTGAITMRNVFFGGWIAGMTQFLGLLYWIPQVLPHYRGLSAFGAWGLPVLQ